jgi:hypothetical protein
MSRASRQRELIDAALDAGHQRALMTPTARNPSLLRF